MDPRIERHAEVLVDQCTGVTAEDDVVVVAPPVAEDLVVALYRRLGEIGAQPTLHWSSARAEREYGRAMDEEAFRTPEHRLAEMEATDVVIAIGGGTNLAETSDVAPEKNAARGRAHEPVFKERLETRWVITQYPAPGSAQKAEMSTAAYEEFVWNAVDRDWEAQRDFQQEMADVLTEGEEVRIRSGDTTDVTMSIEGMRGCNDWGTHNMPAGEVFTAPVRESVEGEVLFDKPVMRNGRELTDVFLRFEEGRVVDFDAAGHVDVLEATLDTDEGARYLGELGIGMNRAIDRFTYNMLFDEKMGDTVHMAVGDAIDECVPEGVEANESAAHVDMIVDMSEDSTIEVDGEVVQRDGTFRFEDGFEA
ncbi:aminopeptidase [Halomarina ordinaria]|uniref:Aminopeptidase n=1 Tax=Halomarina ordinaria TaxID=3033939 RepID=A0ABD5UA33_9EURY|nr:aminopeptidase [Halomarina sp. PSRA2]